MQPREPVRRITTWLAILGYTLVASGLPLPFGLVAPAASDSPAAKRLAGKDRSQPFPCMDKPCGCATAEQCFTKCCCNTPAETLAWAKAHAVEPAVLAALEHRVAGSRKAVNSAAKSSCCSTNAPVVEESCCTTKPSANAVVENVEAQELCSDYPSLAATPTAVASKPEEIPADQPPHAEPRTKSVTLRAMLACSGIVAEWFAAGAALPPPQVEVSLAMRVIEVCGPGDESGESLAASPAAPPPRAA
jgi:hypothetical protein